MTTGAEIERRYLVAAFSPEILRAPSQELVQGYLISRGGRCLRYRIVDGVSAWKTSKSGSGLVRIEEEHPTPVWFARVMLRLCHGRVLRKRRYKRDGWEFDLFQDGLAGLALLERELASASESVVLPPWITKCEEATDWLTNAQLARLAAEIRRGRMRVETTVADLARKLFRS